MLEQVLGVFVDAHRAGAFQLILAIAARQQADTEGVAAPGRQHVPDRIADHDAILDRLAEFFGRGEEQVRIGLGILYFITGDDVR